MTTRCRAAAVQMTCGPDREANLATAARFVEQAAHQGAQLVVLPELFQSFGPPQQMRELAEPIPGPTSRAMSQLAARWQLTLVAGSIAECDSLATGEPAGEGRKAKVFNTSLIFGAQGLEIARYRKQHLFDVALPGGVSIRESDWCVAGTCDCVTQTACGRIGQAICYDLRFPELFRRLASAHSEILVIPSAFALATGRAHWEILLRARAIENQAFVVAANQCGTLAENFESYGHSMIVDPWGKMLAVAGAAEELIVAELDFEKMREIRAQLPALSQRRR